MNTSNIQRSKNKAMINNEKCDVVLKCFSFFETIIDKILILVISNFLVLLLFLFSLILCSCASTHRINVSHTKQDFDDLQVFHKEIILPEVAWEVSEDKMCLNNKEANKLYDNINNIRASHYSILEKYKMSVNSFNVLKEVAYGDKK